MRVGWRVYARTPILQFLYLHSAHGMRAILASSRALALARTPPSWKHRPCQKIGTTSNPRQSIPVSLPDEIHYQMAYRDQLATDRSVLRNRQLLEIYSPTSPKIDQDSLCGLRCNVYQVNVAAVHRKYTMEATLGRDPDARVQSSRLL